MRELKPIFMYRFDLVRLIEKTLKQQIDLESYVRGTSMEPTAYDGDKILIRPFRSPSELRKGMIIAYLSNDKRHFVVHRIHFIDHKKNRVYEQGDNRKNGSFVNYEDIKGIVYCINDEEVRQSC